MRNKTLLVPTLRLAKILPKSPVSGLYAMLCGANFVPSFTVMDAMWKNVRPVQRLMSDTSDGWERFAK